jgi:hypothetical protein
MSFPKNPTSRQKRLLILDPQNVITKNDFPHLLKMSEIFLIFEEKLEIIEKYFGKN